MPHLSTADKRLLLRLARTAVEHAAAGAPVRRDQVHPDPFPTALLEPRGVFVSLHRTRGQRLRGCIGCLEARKPLVDAVLENATAAATRDPRFDPVRTDEVDGLDIEISVLGPLQECDASEIRIGRDGVGVRRDGRRGVLLPQVPLQLGWDRDEFLDNVCRKADLPPDAWRKGASIQRFEAEVFSEGSLPTLADSDAAS